MSGQAFKRVRTSIGLSRCREPLPSWAWPGGHPMYYVFADGGCLCPDCANKNITNIDQELNNSHGWWKLAGFGINYEDDSLCCDHCHKTIPSACEAPDPDDGVETQPSLFPEPP